MDKLKKFPDHNYNINNVNVISLKSLFWALFLLEMYKIDLINFVILKIDSINFELLKFE